MGSICEQFDPIGSLQICLSGSEVFVGIYFFADKEVK
jgi:hypothetical protein